jgi:hypothetical protein
MIYSMLSFSCYPIFCFYSVKFQVTLGYVHFMLIITHYNLQVYTGTIPVVADPDPG